MASRSAQKREESNARSALIWGSLAFCSILAVCVLIALRIGTTGGELATAKISTTPPPAKVVVQKPQSASEFEVARLNDAIRALASERDRLAARVDTLEQSVGDITASINTRKSPTPSAETPLDAQNKPAEMAKAPEAPGPSAPPPAASGSPPQISAPAMQPAPNTATAPRSTSFFAVTDLPNPDKGAAEKPAPSPAAAENITPARTSPVGRIERPGYIAKANTIKRTSTHRAHRTRVAKNPTPTSTSAVPPTPPRRPAVSETKGPATQVAQIMPPPQDTRTDITGATRTEFGIDLGGETSLDGLRARWAKLRDHHGPALEGMRPLVRVREGSRPGTVELHLIAGPVANAGTAARVCATLQSTGIACQASEYDGQRLSVR